MARDGHRRRCEFIGTGIENSGSDGITFRRGGEHEPAEGRDRRGLRQPRVHFVDEVGGAAESEMLKDARGQRGRGRTPVGGAHDCLKRMTAEPIAATFVAEQMSPASGPGRAIAAIAPVGDRTRTGDHDDAWAGFDAGFERDQRVVHHQHGNRVAEPDEHGPHEVGILRPIDAGHSETDRCHRLTRVAQWRQHDLPQDVLDRDVSARLQRRARATDVGEHLAVLGREPADGLRSADVDAEHQHGDSVSQVDTVQMRLVAWRPVVQRALVVAIFGAACLLGDRVVSPVGALTPRAAEIRGVWVVRTSLTSRDDITRVVDTARRGGFNTLFVQVRGRGDAFYKSALEPRSVDLAGQPATFDPLAVTLDLGHRAGLRVHAWIVVNLVSSSVALPRAPGHVVNKHPEWLMVPQPLAKSLHSVAPSARAYLARLADWTREMSDHVEGLYLSPVSPGARQYTVDVVTEIAANYAVDGVHFDYVRFPSEAFDYSAVSLLEFRNAQAASTPAPR